MENYFRVNVNKYVSDMSFDVVRPASVDNPKDQSVMFLSKKNSDRALQLEHDLQSVKQCLVFWPEGVDFSEVTANNHAIAVCENPRKSFCMFFRDNQINNLPLPSAYCVQNGVFIEAGAIIAGDCTIFPGAYIGKDVVIGKCSWIGAGVKLLGRITIGKNVVIRENTVIGADGLTTDRDEEGRALTIPQFGGVTIEDDVQIGANVVIARGAIDDTIIGRGAKVDSSSFISHNVRIGEDTFIVGETIMFGSSSTGKRVLISGNSLVSNYVHIGDDTILGLASAATKSIDSNKIAYGSPAKVARDRG